MKICFSAYITVLLILFSLTDTIAQETANLYARGYYHMPVDREKAIDLFTEVISIDSAHAEALYYRGLSYFKMGEYHKAIDDFTNVLGIKPALKKAILHRGFAYKMLGMNEDALQDFQRYGESLPQDSSAFFHVLSGKTAFDQKNYATAYENFSKAIAINPNDESFLYYRFLASMEGGMRNKALSDINRLIIMRPDFYGYYFQKGNLYFDQGLYEEAEKFYNLSLLKNPYNPDGFFQKGLTFEARGKYTEAIQNYSKAILLNPEEGLYYSRRGHSKLSMRDKEGACADFEEAGKLGFFKDYDQIARICD